MASTELLIVDGSDRSREGLRRFFESRGFLCTALGEAAPALRLLDAKFFPAAVIDLDAGGHGEGLTLIREVRARSPQTTVVLLAGRASFDGAVAAHRAGVEDIVPKTREGIEHLERVVRRASDRYRTADGDAFYEEVRGVLDAALKVMLELSRKAYAHLSLAAIPLRPRILLVDDDPTFLEEMSMLTEDEPWELVVEMTGGSALDRGGRERFDIVVSKQELMDLRGSMIVRSIQAQRSEVAGVLYSPDGDGRLERLSAEGDHAPETPFRGSEHLFEVLRGLVHELGHTAQERRFMQAFRGDHEAFLRRFARLKLDIDRLIDE
jgi:DNA-binding NtrC family response regulator